MKKIVNYVFVHDRQIKDLFIQKSKELNSNLVEYNRFVCARKPELTDFTPENDVISVYDKKYEELNGKIRMMTGVMKILDTPEMINGYDYVGIQRCSVIWNFPYDVQWNGKIPYILFFGHEIKNTMVDEIRSWAIGWREGMNNRIIPTLNRICSRNDVSDRVLNFMDWFFHDTNRKFLWMNLAFLHHDILVQFKRCLDIALDLWTEVAQLYRHEKECDTDNIANVWDWENLDMYARTLEYVICKNVGMDRIKPLNLKSMLFDFSDDKYHCRGR